MVILMVYPVPSTRTPKTPTSPIHQLNISSPPQSAQIASQNTLPSQLNFPCKLTLLPPAFTPTNRYPLAQLCFIFDGFPCARTVVWEVNAREGARAEVVCALGCWDVSDPRVVANITSQRVITHLPHTAPDTNYYHSLHSAVLGVVAAGRRTFGRRSRIARRKR